MHTDHPPDWRDRFGAGRVLLIGALSGMLYLALYFIQRAIFLNGRRSDAPASFPAMPASGARLIWALLGYGIVTVTLFVLYASLLVACQRGGLQDRRARRLALGLPVVFNAGLLFGRPYLSTDVFSYMVHGYVGTLPGRNPYVDRVRDMASSDVGMRVAAWGWKPETHDVSPYGPLWTQFEIAVARLTPDVSTQVLLLKCVVVAANLLSSLLIWYILGRVRPQVQLLGTLLYLWNPMIVVEFAAEGHNDALMIVFAFLAILFTVQARPAGTLVALMLGILTKYLPVLLMPAQLMYSWRTHRSWRQLLYQLMTGATVALALAVVLYSSLWAGAATFQGVLGQGTRRFIAANSTTVFWLLQQTQSEANASRWTSLIVNTIFGCYLLYASLSVRNASDLLRACAGIMLVYLLVASPSYWPWYATLPLALMALVPEGRFFWMSLVLSFCSRLTAPLSNITVNGFASWSTQVWTTTAIGLLVPLLAFVILSARTWRQGVQPSNPLARA